MLTRLSLAALLLGLCAAGCKKETPAATAPAAATPATKSPVMPMPVAAKSAAAALPIGTGGVAVAASVDGVTLSREELLQQVQSILAAQQVPAEQQQMAFQMLAPRIVGSFVTKTLLLAEVKRLKIVVDAADRKKYLQPIEEMAAKQGTTVDAMIKMAPMGEKQARQELEEQFLIEKLVDTQVRGKIKLDDKAVDTAFADAQKERTEKRAQIDGIRAQLLAGTNFEAVARESSDCPSGKQSGGDLGTFERARMVKPFADAAFTQKVGDIGPVVETEFGFHVIKVTAHNEARPANGETNATPETVQASHILIKAPPAVTRDGVRKEQENKQIGEEMQTYLTALRGKAKITTMFDRPAGAPTGNPEEPEIETHSVQTAGREEERQQQERLANARGAIEGGAWVVKGGGQSELLRGLTVYVLPALLDSQKVQVGLAGLRKECSYWQEVSRQSADKYSRPVPHVTDADFDDMTKEVPKYKATEMLMKKYGDEVDGWTKNSTQLKTIEVYNTTRMVNRDCQGSDEISRILYVDHADSDKAWPAIVAVAALSKGTTGIDAKYSITDLKPGEYILYARMSTAFSLIEWCIPIAIKGEQTAKQDFFNDNAVLILSKK